MVTARRVTTVLGDTVDPSREESHGPGDGEGLEYVLNGVESVVDVTNVAAGDRPTRVAHFGAATRNLLAAERSAGVRHHVLLSIVGLDRIKGNAHYAGKREQESMVIAGPPPWTIVPAKQFHDFAATVTSWTETTTFDEWLQAQR